ncbi:hypothetical protein EMIHUDRAFT_101170 [Emiliania huxleyi CCMP1516]|uniref:Suppressor of forked domain-containing protein n=2 Tax=Emiliania huxleyi TaxID=2903 RepID=A0A0D3JKB2_EMIH1|nr:hypothetical protein EMIHUDRAFT_101170 [Emiliania huxleyi CCMP1516]EOD23947.1 hypothetical protein EMIHUDRAFT_101170 [Emiliania huxleyi CCMP1516]|eukprot:XP_005776376.1 hypothetical protein EMIHUDRAFT_101170 [Emiliania huxleyi CCMP1516]
MGWERSPVALRMSERIRADPLDTDAWRILLAEAARQPPADFRPVFEAAVTAMPEASAAWMGWAEAELGASEVEQAEAVFELCLLRLPQLPLWHLFLKFVREHKVAQLERSAARAQLVPALELLLEAVGADPSAGPLWTEYVSLTAAAEAGAEADGALVSAAELSATRKAYQAALTSCAAGLDGLLREYEAWETRTSGSQAKAMMHDTLEKAAAARKAHFPPGVATPRLLAAWRKLWAYEASNAQRLDPPKLAARMRFALAQGAAALWRAPQLWHEAARWLEGEGNAPAAREVLRSPHRHPLAAAALPSATPSLLAALAAAAAFAAAALTAAAAARGFEERQGKMDDAAALLDTLVAKAPSAAAHAHSPWPVYAAAAQLEYMLGEERAAAAETGRRVYALALAKASETARDAEASAQAKGGSVPAGLVLSYASYLRASADLPNLRAPPRAGRELLERGLLLLPAAEAAQLWPIYAQALALEHSYEGTAPPSAAATLEMEAAVAALSSPGGAPRRGTAPQLSACTEYTGVEHRTQEKGGGGGASSAASVPIPPQLASWLAALPPPSLPLWHLFLKFVREHKVAQLERSAARAQLVPALELLLEAVGADPSAGPLWTEYVSLTAAAEAGAEADGALVSAAELSATRKAYQAALTSCAAGLDGLLREYEAWETRTSGSQAKAMMHDTLEKAAAARKAHFPPGVATPRLLAAWRKLWAYEASNAQRLDPPKLAARMRFALAQGAAALWRAPQLWHEAARWLEGEGNAPAAREVGLGGGVGAGGASKQKRAAAATQGGGRRVRDIYSQRAAAQAAQPVSVRPLQCSAVERRSTALEAPSPSMNAEVRAHASKKWRSSPGLAGTATPARAASCDSAGMSCSGGVAVRRTRWAAGSATSASWSVVSDASSCASSKSSSHGGVPPISEGARLATCLKPPGVAIRISAAGRLLAPGSRRAVRRVGKSFAASLSHWCTKCAGQTTSVRVGVWPAKCTAASASAQAVLPKPTEWQSSAGEPSSTRV